MDKLRMYQSMTEMAREEAMRTDPDMLEIHFHNIKTVQDLHGNLRKEMRKCKLAALIANQSPDRYTSQLMSWFGVPQVVFGDMAIWQFNGKSSLVPSGETFLRLDQDLRLYKKYSHGWVEYIFPPYKGPA